VIRKHPHEEMPMTTSIRLRFRICRDPQGKRGFSYLVQCNEGDNLLALAKRSAARHPCIKIRELAAHKDLHLEIDGELADENVGAVRADEARNLCVRVFDFADDSDDSDGATHE
jgi:hypothetical protein